MPSIAVENYVKEILLAEQELDGAYVPMGAVAKALDVTPGTATAMLKSLAQSGLADYEPRHGAKLTEKGRAIALRMLRKHRIVESYLVGELGLDWSEVHVEAENMEHAISDRVLDCMDARLGHPTVDPHGYPIPSAGGSIELRKFTSLAEAVCEKKYRIERVSEQSSEFLQFLNERGLRPGTLIKVVSRNVAADVITLSNESGQVVTMGINAAGKVFVS
jgi:DtxR family transcriptional regulator, Mn-dependent transcriptional regulator